MIRLLSPFIFQVFICLILISFCQANSSAKSSTQLSLNTKTIFSKKEKQWLLAHPVIRLGIDSAYPPVEFVDKKGIYKGLSAEYMKVISEILGVRMEPVFGLSWEQVLARVKAKEIDLIPVLTPTPERKKYMNFTEVYIDTPLVIFVRKQTPFFSGPVDLLGKRVAVEKGYASGGYLKNDFPTMNLILADSAEDALNLLSVGKVDAYMGDLIVGSYLINNKGLGNIKVGAPTSYYSGNHMGVREDWPELRTILQKALNSLSEEDKGNIRKKWLTVHYEVSADYRIIWQIAGIAAVFCLFMFYRNRVVTRQKEQLRASEKQFKALINALPIAIVVAHREGEIIFNNSQASLEFGGEKSLIGHHTTDFYARENERERLLGIISEKGLVKSEHVKYRTDSGKILDCLLSVIPIRFDGKNALLGLMLNISERIKVEKTLARAKKHAEEADYLKSAFLASMSHELRTPLNSIIGFSGILQQELAGQLNDEQRKQVSIVQSSSRHLLALINDVLDISKIEAGEVTVFCKEFNIRESFEKVVKSVTPLAEQRGLLLKLIVSPEVLTVCSDQRRVEQILLNLLGNSVKFTETGEVSVSCHVENDFLVTDVKDSGSGIKAEDIDKLFRTFQQIDQGQNRVKEGTGLGLSISKKLVDKLEGTIKVESEWGVGSTFSFSLPLKNSNLRQAQQCDIYENKNTYN